MNLRWRAIHGNAWVGLVAEVEGDTVDAQRSVAEVDDVEASVIHIGAVIAEHFVCADSESAGWITGAKNIVAQAAEELILVCAANHKVVAVIAVENVAA